MLVEKKYSIMVKEDAEQRILKAVDEVNNLRLELKKFKQDPKVFIKEYIAEQVKIEKDKFEAIMNEKDKTNKENARQGQKLHFDGWLEGLTAQPPKCGRRREEVAGFDLGRSQRGTTGARGGRCGR